MAVSFGKKENEKKKQAKRLQKQKRKEERKAGGPSSPDDMIAYVDENGVISATPPEERKKEDVKLEDIVIAIPKREAMEPEILKGRVEHLNSARGYGFIKDVATTEKYFFLASSAPTGIAEGDIVNFETERGQRGMNAVSIVLVK